MKRWLSIVCLSSTLVAQELEEIAALDLDLMNRQPISAETELPPPQMELRYKSPLLTVGLAALFPGLGHAYLGDLRTAGALMGTAGAGIGAVSFANQEKPLFTTSLIALQNTWSYGIYAAYRDVRLFNGSSGYSYKMPTDSLADLSLAPFRWKVLKKPEVWGGLLGTIAVAAGMAYFAYPSGASIHPPVLSSSETQMQISPLMAFPVGIGEEALFRGYLQSQLAETFTPWGGILLSSLLFGAVHIPNGLLLAPEVQWRYFAFSVPFITTLGAYFGWVTYKNHSLQESVALHSWYDFILLGVSALASQTAVTGRPGFALAVPF